MKKFLITSFLYLLLIINGTYAQLIQIECPIKPLAQASSHKHEHYKHQKKKRDNSTYLRIPHPVEASSSTNWSGYVAVTNLLRPAKNSVNNVSGSWTVPDVIASTNTAYSAIWVGIDGYSNSTVEQIGTEHDWTPFGQQNYAWFEMYPRGAYEIVGFPLNVGDSISAQVSYSGSNRFSLRLYNNTQGVYTIIPSSYTTMPGAQRSSAEWIVEAPSSNLGILPLADFSHVAFTNCTANLNGVTGGIKNRHWVFDSITMRTQSGAIKALPSSLSSNGESFSVTWEHE